MRLYLALLLLVLVPTGQACSLAISYFEDADLGDDILVTTLGQDAVRIDLKTGAQTVLTQHYFPRVAIDDKARWMYIGGQDGLDADCSGQGFLIAKQPTGAQREGAGVVAFDVHDKAAFIRGDKVHIVERGRVDGGVTFTIDVPAADPFNAPTFDIAIRDLVAVSAGEDVRVYDLTGKHVRTLDHEGAVELAWFGDKLVVAVGQGEKTEVHIEGMGSMQLTADGWHRPHIAAGKDLYVQFGDQVVHIHDGKASRLNIPSAYMVSNIAADDDGAVLLVQEAGYPDASPAGIQRLDGATFKQWLAYQQGDWNTASRPAWSWAAAEPLHQDPSQEAPGGSRVDVPGPMALLPLLVGLFIARRIR